MNATMRFIVWGTIPVGSILGGILATALGLHQAIWIGAIGSVLAVVPLLITPVHTLKTMPEPVDGAPSVDAADALTSDGLIHSDDDIDTIEEATDLPPDARASSSAEGWDPRGQSAPSIGTLTPRSCAISMARS